MKNEGHVVCYTHVIGAWERLEEGERVSERNTRKGLDRDIQNSEEKGKES